MNIEIERIRKIASKILNQNDFSKFEVKLLELLLNSDRILVKEDIETSMYQFQELSIESKQEKSQKIVLEFIKEYLNNNEITKEELKDFNYLRQLFSIKENDFFIFSHIKKEVLDLVRSQVYMIHLDYKVDESEKQLIEGLRGVFDISYSQLQKITSTIIGLRIKGKGK